MVVDSRVRARVNPYGVREAFFRGDFELVLKMVDAILPRDAEETVETEFLRARAMLALDRAEDALETIRSLHLGDRPADEFLTAQMLIGAALVRLDQTGRAIEILGEAHTAAKGAHPTIRSEIALNLGIAHFRRDEHTQALRLLASVGPEADILFVRALESRAWTAFADGKYAAAAKLFDDALEAIPRCRHYDRFVHAKTLYGVATLAVELLRLDRWPELRLRMTAMDWTVPGLGVPHFWLAVMASFIVEMLGDYAEAIRWASVAEESAPTAACAVVAACRLAAVLGRRGESGAHGHFVRKAKATYDALPRDAAFRSEHSLALTLAEEISWGEAPLDAEPLLAFYREEVEPLVRRRADRAILAAVRDSVEARLEVVRGNQAEAVRSYAASFETFMRVGYRRRAAIVAYRLAGLTGDPRYRAYAEGALRDADDAYWVKAGFARIGSEERS